jgi:circadian clock protein KaiB
MDLTATVLPQSFKGLALFTPGGDLVYWVDPDKQGHWHAHLCEALAETLNLPDIPLFLADEFTATVDRFFDSTTQQLKILAEAQPKVWRYRPILNLLFGTALTDWQLGNLNRKQFSGEGIAHYKAQYPQLWCSHNLILCLDKTVRLNSQTPLASQQFGYVFRFYVNGQKDHPAKVLETVHTLLEQEVKGSYTLRVVDVRQNPALAEQDQISATPTLIRVWPSPKRRLVGSLDQTTSLMRLLV